MTVNLVVAKSLGGAQAADALAGGGNGVDLGAVVNGEWTPIILKSNNTGWQSLYVSHDAVTDPITDVKTFISPYSQTYGGAGANAAADFATLIAKGTASGNSANNADGLSAGLRVEHGADVSNLLGASAFLGTRAQVKIYGDNGSDGISLSSAFNMHSDAAIWNNAGTPVTATAPATGKIGKSGDTALGDVGLFKLRLYLEQAASNGGIIQWDWVIAYAFTA